MLTCLTHYKVLYGDHFIQNELPTFRILVSRMWYITKGNSRRVKSGSLFTTGMKEESPKCGSILETALFLVLHDHIQKYPSLEEALKHTSEAFASLRHFEDAIKKVKGQKEMKPEEKINLSHYR